LPFDIRGDNLVVQVRAIPGQEHLPWAEVHLDAVDAGRWREASAAARGLGKSGLQVWTTEETPGVVAFLEARGYREVLRYLRFELDVAAAPDPAEPEWELTTLAERPDLLPEVYELSCATHRELPGREDANLGPLDAWRSWSYDPHPKDAYYVAVADGRVVGFGILKVEGDAGEHLMTAVAREWRGRGVAEAIKRAHIRWAKQHGLRVLRTANEVRIPAIRRLNERYGYEQRPAEIVLRGPLAPID
jgi:mycothiol synthase